MIVFFAFGPDRIELEGGGAVRGCAFKLRVCTFLHFDKSRPSRVLQYSTKD